MPGVRRSYTPRTLKILWGRAAGRCAMPDCRAELLADNTEYDPILVIGEIAHIHAASPSGPRPNTVVSTVARNEYENLILLCQNCHARVDGQPGFYTVERLRALRNDHEAWVRASLPERGRSRTGWSVLLLRGPYPFDAGTIPAALSPDFALADSEEITCDTDHISWPAVGSHIGERVGRLLAAGDSFDFRVAVFPLAPVSACIALGFHLTNRPRVRLFQYHRDDHSWRWPPGPTSPDDLSMSGLPDEVDEACRSVCFAFHLSAPISLQSTDELALPGHRRIDIRAAVPSTTWLSSPEQIRRAARIARDAFEGCRVRCPRATDWHLFYAGPAPIAVAVGQQLNPTMTPRVHLYEYRQNRSPSYVESLVLNGNTL